MSRHWQFQNKPESMKSSNNQQLATPSPFQKCLPKLAALGMPAFCAEKLKILRA